MKGIENTCRLPLPFSLKECLQALCEYCCLLKIRPYERIKNGLRTLGRVNKVFANASVDTSVCHVFIIIPMLTIFFDKAESSIPIQNFILFCSLVNSLSTIFKGN